MSGGVQLNGRVPAEAREQFRALCGRHGLQIGDLLVELLRCWDQHGPADGFADRCRVYHQQWARARTGHWRAGGRAGEGDAGAGRGA